MVTGAGEVYLELYGTGARTRTSLENVMCMIGGVAACAAAQGVIGLNQTKIRIADSLRGRGEAQLLLTVPGKTVNPVTLNGR